MSPLVGVLDYGSGNLHSACRALAGAGASVRLSSSARELAGCHRLVVPGVGAFAACMAGLTSVGGPQLIREFVDRQRPVLGICVGHQVLFARGVEHGQRCAGVGIYPGTVQRLRVRRLPHMGWNELMVPANSGLLAGLAGQHFYFVHSYAAHATDDHGQPSIPVDAVVTYARHEDDQFIAAVEWRGVTSTQFHPEKSGVAGAMALRNWLMS